MMKEGCTFAITPRDLNLLNKASFVNCACTIVERRSELPHNFERYS